MSSAVRLCQQDKGAECLIYMKAKNNDSDLIGNILGSNGARLRPIVKVDPFLEQLLVYLHRVLLLANVVEIIQISKEDAHTDQRASLVSEQKLMNKIQSEQKNIDRRNPNNGSITSRRPTNRDN